MLDSPILVHVSAPPPRASLHVRRPSEEGSSSIRPQANITILNVQQALDPVINVAQPLADGASAPPSPTLAAGPSPSAVAVGRRLLAAATLGPGGCLGKGRRLRRARRLARRRLRQAVPAAEIFAATDAPLQAVDVTMNLQASSPAQVCSCDMAPMA